MCRKKADPLGSRSYSPPSRSVEFLAIKFLAPWRSLTSVHPRNFHSLVPFDFVFRLPRTSLTAERQGSTENGVTNRWYLSWKIMFQVLRLPKNAPARVPSGTQTKTSAQSNARHSSRTGQARRRPVQPPGSNTRVYLDFVSETFIFQKLLYVVAYWIDVLEFISSVGRNQRGGW